MPVFIDNVDGQILHFSDMDGSPFHTFADKNVVFKFHQLRRSLYVGRSGKLYYIERRAARQFQRGVCHANTRAYVYSPERRSFLETRVNHALMADLMFPADKFTHGVKLSEQFAIAHDTVFLYIHPVGQVVGNQIVVINKNFTQEIRDAVRDNKLSFEVLNA